VTAINPCFALIKFMVSFGWWSDQPQSRFWPWFGWGEKGSPRV